jgi:hypothetical protein
MGVQFGLYGKRTEIVTVFVFQAVALCVTCHYTDEKLQI